jgi:hypothetical protein
LVNGALSTHAHLDDAEQRSSSILLEIIKEEFDNSDKVRYWRCQDEPYASSCVDDKK